MQKKTKGRLIEFSAIFIFLIIGAGLPILLTFEPERNIEIESDKDFKRNKFPGNGSIDNPYIIENFTISNALKRAISVQNTESYFIIRNCSFSYNLFNGIYLDGIKTGTAKIYNNVIIGHSRAGIQIINSDQIEIYDNIYIDNKHGIWLNNSDGCIIENNIIYTIRPADRYGNRKTGIRIDESNDVEIIGNYFERLAYGISVLNGENCLISDNILETLTHVDIELINSTLCQIENNISSENNLYFISLIDSNEISIINCTSLDNIYGIFIFSSENNYILNNTFVKNYIGIYLVGDNQENIITYNEFFNSTHEGVNIGSGILNKVYHNSFFYNNLVYPSQVKDDGTSNSWFDINLSEGNYWSGWNVSLPYLISGSANTTDPFPLSLPI
ncbi:MAG: right-handed parallel beta-helix repeat-containing protein [Candidatus Heimdallarchaeota archaeon]